MENGGISNLDNIVVCGEDDSENLILSFYGTFPEANVSRLEFDDLDLTLLDEESLKGFSAYSVPAAVANEYYDELAEEYQGINLLPKYVRDEQKAFQFAWHGYAMFPLLFGAAFFLTINVLKNNHEINELDTQIAAQTILLRENQEVLSRITELERKISTFDQTQAILDSAAVGTGVWSSALSDISGFFAGRKNIWLTRFNYEGKEQVTVEGYATSRKTITDFAYSVKSAELKKVTYEALRDAKTYKFNIVFNIAGYQNK
jgi:Tfp pilus assembly protein PilN